jgi:hypothetical protein
MYIIIPCITGASKPNERLYQNDRLQDLQNLNLRVLHLAIRSLNIICFVSIQETSISIIFGLFISTIKNLDIEKIYKQVQNKGNTKTKEAAYDKC